MEEFKFNKKPKNEFKKFFEKTKDASPRTYLVDACNHIKSKDIALDLGAGTLRDTKYMLDQGFQKVIAMDSANIITDIEKEISDDRLKTIVSRFEDFDFPENTYDLINAQYSLPFMMQENNAIVLEKIISSLKTGGVFTGTFFGNNDEWNTEVSQKSFHTREDIEKIFDAFTFLDFIEKEEDKPTGADVIKHWHTFHVTVKKES